MNNIDWITKWYESQCDGDWEHYYGIQIETTDNPGWSVTIETNGTEQVLSDIPWTLNGDMEQQWFGYKVEEGAFKAAGDPSKLDHLLGLFIEVYQQNRNREQN